MSSYIEDELSFFGELIMSVLFTACVGVYLAKSSDSFPELTFAAIPVGLAIVVGCWKGKKYPWTALILGLLLNTIVWSLFFNLLF